MSRHASVPTILILAAAVIWTSSIVTRAAGQQHPATPHRHPDAQKLTNPVPANAESIKAGKELYAKNCAECQGELGKGDGPGAEGLEPPPQDLTDAEWQHGSSDGELFVVIRDGTPVGMRSFRLSLKPEQIWQIVDYLRTIGPKGGAAKPGA